MNIAENIALKDYTTMKLGGDARYFITIESTEDILEAHDFIKKNNLDFFVLGGGSNVIARDEGFSGAIILNRIKGFEVIAEDESSVTLKIGAGENWDSVASRTVEMGLSGVETMSGIPGTAGAAPVQNVGAYGQEIADTMVELEAYDWSTSAFTKLANKDCDFSYRHSIFRASAWKRYLITSITIKLSKTTPKPPFYKALQDYFDDKKITEYSPKIIREAVLQIRKNKLPDPSVQPNSGSFFKNTLIDSAEFAKLIKQFPSMPSYKMPNDEYKIPTGWLIDQAGLKGKTIDGMQVHQQNALVLKNISAKSYNDLSEARDFIKKTVKDKFGVKIKQEPLEIN